MSFTGSASGLQTAIGTDPGVLMSVLEGLVQNSARAFALMDTDLTIIFANQRMEDLFGDETALGTSLSSCFPHDESAVRELCQSPRNRVLHRFIFRRPGDDIDRRVTCEFGRLQAGSKVFSLVHMAEARKFVEADYAAFEQAEFGVLRMDSAQPTKIVYANQVAANMLNLTQEKVRTSDLDLCDLFEDADEKQTIANQLDRQIRKRSTRFDMKLPRKDRTPLPVSAYAFPQTGLDRAGNTVILFATERSEVRRQLHDLTEDLRKTPHKLAKEGIKVVGGMIPHAFAVLTLYEDKGRWCWPVHVEPRPEEPWSTQWFPLPSLMVTEMQSKPKDIYAEVDDDLEAALAQFPDAEALRKDEVTDGLIRDGFTSIMTLPSRDADGNWLASLTLFRKAGDFFTEAERQDAIHGGVPGLVSTLAASFAEREDRVFSDLRESVTAADSLGGALQEIIERLCRFFRWQHMSIFLCDHAEGKFRLVKQSAYQPETSNTQHLMLPDDYEQDFDTGLLGKCFRDNAETVVNDTQADTAEAHLFHRQHPDTRAELCMPINVRGLLSDEAGATINRPVFLLNAEDRRRNSFPDPTLKKMRQFKEMLEITLVIRQRRAILETLQKEAGSAILLVDKGGVVWGANQKALKLLRRDTVPDRVAEIFTTSTHASMVLKNTGVDELRVPVLREDGTIMSALLSASDISAQYTTRTDDDHVSNLRLIYLSDLSHVDFDSDMTALKAMVSSMAEEMKPSIALAFGNLNKLRKDVVSHLHTKLDKESIQGRIERIEGLLAKMDVDSAQYIQKSAQAAKKAARKKDEIEKMRFGHADAQTDIVRIFNDIADETAEQHGDRQTPQIHVSSTQKNIRVRVKEAHLEAFVKKIVDYVLRHRATPDAMTAKLHAENGRALVEVSSVLKKTDFDGMDSFSRTTAVARDMVEANEETLRIIARNFEGDLDWHEGTDTEATRIGILLPLATAEGDEGGAKTW